MSRRVVGFVADVDDTVHYVIGAELQDLTHDGFKVGQRWISWQVLTRCGHFHDGNPTTAHLSVTCIQCLNQPD